MQLLKFSSGKTDIPIFLCSKTLEAPNDNCNHYIFFFFRMWENVRNPELYFDLTSQITLLVLLQANCGVFVLGLLLLFPFRDSNTSTCINKLSLSLGEFQAVCLLVKDNTATLEQEWSSSILPCCYIWRNVNTPDGFLQLSQEGRKFESCVLFHLRI